MGTSLRLLKLRDRRPSQAKGKPDRGHCGLSATLRMAVRLDKKGSRSGRQGFHRVEAWKPNPAVNTMRDVFLRLFKVE